MSKPRRSYDGKPAGEPKAKVTPAWMLDRTLLPKRPPGVQAAVERVAPPAVETAEEIDPHPAHAQLDELGAAALVGPDAEDAEPAPASDREPQAPS